MDTDWVPQGTGPEAAVLSLNGHFWAGVIEAARGTGKWNGPKGLRVRWTGGRRPAGQPVAGLLEWEPPRFLAFAGTCPCGRAGWLVHPGARGGIGITPGGWLHGEHHEECGRG